MEWEYKITKSDLGYNVYRKQELENWMLRLERLQRDTYTLNREFARTFYTIWDAESALIVARRKWRIEEVSEKVPECTPEIKVEKQSRSELW